MYTAIFANRKLCTKLRNYPPISITVVATAIESFLQARWTSASATQPVQFHV